MKYCIAVLFFILYSVIGDAQTNYVLNPGFEQYSQCPIANDQIYLADHWSAIDSIGQPDCNAGYFNTCGIGEGAEPVNADFYHYPRTGNGMAGIIAFVDQNFPYPLCSYAEGRLYTPLTAGKNYCVTFYVSLNDQSEYAVNNMGAYLDRGEIDTAVNTCNIPQTQYTPQIHEDSIIADTVNWIKVQGSFVANGTERFITIGNFLTAAHTSHIINNLSGGVSEGSQYLIDDVSVIPSDAVADAGPDAAIGLGDSAYIGPPGGYEDALPYTWYIKGNPIAIDSGGGIYVKPDTTTSYVVEQDLCGVVTYDTVTVWVWPEHVGNVGNEENVMVWPNPVKDDLTLSLSINGEGIINGNGKRTFVLYDMVGREVYTAIMKSYKESFDVSNLPDGTYILQIIASDGSRTVRKIIIEK